MFPYHNLGTKPVFATTINSKRKSRWNRIFGGGKSGGYCEGGTKPVTRAQLCPDEDYYSRYGIYWCGSDSRSVINSLAV
tara:strand:+ start:313 stop:549 length:237 start_codon:yes stop_codon:yes gene_type:complete